MIYITEKKSKRSSNPSFSHIKTNIIYKRSQLEKDPYRANVIYPNISNVVSLTTEKNKNKHCYTKHFNYKKHNHLSTKHKKYYVNTQTRFQNSHCSLDSLSIRTVNKRSKTEIKEYFNNNVVMFAFPPYSGSNSLTK